MHPTTKRQPTHIRIPAKLARAIEQTEKRYGIDRNLLIHIGLVGLTVSHLNGEAWQGTT